MYINGIKIGQSEVVKQCGFISVRSNYKEYLTFNCTLYCFILTYTWFCKDQRI